jgi:hypothetical protein
MTKQRNKVGTAIDAGASLLAGGAAAFLLFAIPEELLARAFAATGLASFSPKFQPPIGAGLRAALVAAAAIIAFAFVWSLMKALDRKPAAAAASASAKPVRLPEPEADAPRLRKADAHPDAPRRRPLLAGRDLGEPLDLETAQPAEEPLDLTQEAEEEFIPQPQPQLVAAAEPTPAPAPRAEPGPAPVAVPQTEALPSFLVAQPEEAEQPEAERHEEEPQPAETGEDSIVSLMARFETGLTRKKQALPERRAIDPVPPPPAPPAYTPAPPAYAAAPQPAPQADPVPAPPAPEPAPAGPAPVGHRLRGAMADLQKVAGR